MIEWGGECELHVLNTKGISVEMKTIIKYQIELPEIKQYQK